MTLERANRLFGTVAVKFIAVLILLGSNQGVAHWVAGALLVLSGFLDLWLWYARRRRSADGPAKEHEPNSLSP